jgi:hypothetical protein
MARAASSSAAVSAYRRLDLGAKRRGNPGDRRAAMAGSSSEEAAAPYAPGSPRRRRAAPRDDGATPFGQIAKAISAQLLALIAIVVGRGDGDCVSKPLPSCRRRGAANTSSDWRGQPQEPTNSQVVSLSPSRRQRRQDAGPGAGAFVERNALVFLVGRMNLVVVAGEPDQQAVHAELALERADDRDRPAAAH